MRVIGGGKGTQGSKEGGGQRERAGQGGEGEAAAVDANRQGVDGDATNGEMIRKTVTEKVPRPPDEGGAEEADIVMIIDQLN